MTRELDRPLLKAPAATATVRPSRAPRPLVVLIVTYKSHDLAEKCLGQLAEHLPDLPVYVYENSGADYPGREELAARNPHARWVIGPVNLGFAAAVNALVEHTPPDADLLLLNPDAQLLGPLDRTRRLIRRRGVAAVAPLVWDTHGAGPQHWDVATRRRTLLRALVSDAGHSERLRGTPFSFLYREQPDESHGVEGFLAGACLAINRDAWNTIGGFDEEFFLYGEETDWQTRARAAGWKLLLANEAGANHGDAFAAARAPARRGACTRPWLRTPAHQHRPAARARAFGSPCRHVSGGYLAAGPRSALQACDRRRTTAARRTGLPHIVITTNRLVYGGAERQKVLLATELDRRGYPVSLVCLQRFGPLAKTVPHSVHLVRQPWWAPMIDGPDGPSVVIASDTNTEAGFATLWRGSGKDRRWLVSGHIPPAEDGPIYSRPLAAAMSRADGFIALAEQHWEMLTAHHRLGDRVFISPNGVAPGVPTPRRHLAGRPPHLVMLSRIVEHKNPHMLIEALAGLTEMHWRLSIFGDGPDRQDLEARTPSTMRHRVTWHGWSDGPDRALADADLLCVPSRSEAFPLVILEAMARAVPVAASGVCAVPEMLDRGRAGIVVDPISVAGWRDALRDILANPADPPRDRALRISAVESPLHDRSDDRRVYRGDRGRPVKPLRVLWLSPWMRPLARVYTEALRRRGAEVQLVTTDQHPGSDTPRDYELVLDPRLRSAASWPATLRGMAANSSLAARRRRHRTGARPAMDHIRRDCTSRPTGAR